MGDLEKLDQDKRKLFEEGCAPKEIEAEESDETEEEALIPHKKVKKEKWKKKQDTVLQAKQEAARMTIIITKVIQEKGEEILNQKKVNLKMEKISEIGRIIEIMRKITKLGEENMKEAGRHHMR